MSKHILREHAKKIRSQSDMAYISLEVIKKLKTLPEFEKASNIMLYYPYRSEMDFLSLLDAEDKKWLLPRVNGENLDVCFYEKKDQLDKNKWGIPEPCISSEAVDKDVLDMVVLPGLCADKKGFRLGYGLGFYDRFVRDLPTKCVKVLPVLEELFIDELPKDQWDEPVDIIITEKNVYRQ